MIRIALAALAGAYSLLTPPLASSNAPGATDTDPEDVISVRWPGHLDQNVRKLRSAALFDRGSNELMVLAGSELCLVRDPMSAPAVQRVATGVTDFVVFPQKNGISRVLSADDRGLLMSAVGENSFDPTIRFEAVVGCEEWSKAVWMDAKADEQGAVWVVAASDTVVLRGKFEEGAFSATDSIPIGETILGLAVADASATPGLEVAVVTGAGVRCFDEGGSLYRTIPSAYPVEHLSRIPLGADVRDSFGFTIHYPAYDTFHELVGSVLSNPLYGGPIRIGDLTFATLGLADTRADMLFAATSSPDMVVLHGQPQGQPSDFPFNWNWNEWSVFGLTENDMQHPPTNPVIGCGDFDGDGDTDLAMAGPYDEEMYLVFKRGLGYETCATELDVDLSQVDLVTGSPIADVELVSLVPQPPSFNGVAPTRIRVRAYLRGYGPGLYGSTTESEFLVEEFIPVDSSGGVASVYPTNINLYGLVLAPYDSESALIYFEIVPQIHDPLTGGTLQRANATIWVGAADGVAPEYASELLMDLTCVYEQDQYSELYCPVEGATDGAPLVTDVRRRKVLRPIQSTPAPGN